MRLIDADVPRKQMEKLLDHHLLTGNYLADSIVSDSIELLDLAPTIDAVPVVRCKDCNHANFGDYDFCVCDKRSKYHNFVVHKDEFCSFGEQRTKMDGERRAENEQKI